MLRKTGAPVMDDAVAKAKADEEDVGTERAVAEGREGQKTEEDQQEDKEEHQVVNDGGEDDEEGETEGRLPVAILRRTCVSNAMAGERATSPADRHTTRWQTCCTARGSGSPGQVDGGSRVAAGETLLPQFEAVSTVQEVATPSSPRVCGAISRGHSSEMTSRRHSGRGVLMRRREGLPPGRHGGGAGEGCRHS